MATSGVDWTDMINVTQLRDFVVRPALNSAWLHSRAAENLVMGTGMTESGYHYLRQVDGPALGFWQMEPATHDDIWSNFLDFREPLARRVRDASGMVHGRPVSGDLVYNLRYAALMCRVRYLRVPEPLPAADDVKALADYWKAHYNTPGGAGKPEDFVRSYMRLSVALRRVD